MSGNIDRRNRNRPEIFVTFVASPMADQLPLVVSPEDVNTSVDLNGAELTAHGSANGGDLSSQLLIAQKRLSDLEFAKSGLEKGMFTCCSTT